MFFIHFYQILFYFDFLEVKDLEESRNEAAKEVVRITSIFLVFHNAKL